MDSWLNYAGLAALGTALFSFRSAVLGFWQQAAGLVLVRVTLPAPQRVTVCNWLRRNGRLLSTASQYAYTTEVCAVDAVKMAADEPERASWLRNSPAYAARVPQRLPPRRAVWLLYGWVPIWSSSDGNTGGGEGGPISSGSNDMSGIVLTFIRGTLCPHWLADVLTQYEERLVCQSRVSQFRVIRISGLLPAVGAVGGKVAHNDYSRSPAPVGVNDGKLYHVQITHHSTAGLHRDLFYYDDGYIPTARRYEHASSLPAGQRLDDLDLPPAAALFTKRLRFWLAGRGWYVERGVPWKLGAGFVGPPGTGKTATIRALGAALGLPVLLFDLPTLNNTALTDAWSKEVCQHAPAIVVLEDIDRAFTHDSAERGSVTLDCLLNLIDGVAVADGVVTILTANHPERLSSTLFTQKPDGSYTLRPGRVDYVVEFGPLSAAGRQKIATRILAGHPEEIQALAQAGENDTGAAFQLRCMEAAQQLYWRDYKEDAHGTDN